MYKRQEQLQPPQDGTDRNLDGLLFNLKQFHIPPQEQYAIILKSNLDVYKRQVIDNTTSRGRTLRFLYDGPHDEFKKALYALGETPLPHRDVYKRQEQNRVVVFDRGTHRVGDFVMVKVTESSSATLKGEEVAG